jgi:hypothetical protein
MAGKVNPGRQRSALARGIAWLILIIWAGFWIFFNIASGIGEIGELGPMALITHLTMPLVILVLLFICWRWELWGGLLLILATLFAFYFFHIGDQNRDPVQQLMMVSSLILPSLLTGMLLILCGIESWRGAKEMAES